MRRGKSMRFCRSHFPSLCALALFLSFAGCATVDKAARQQQRAAAAKELFEQTVKLYHLPSGEAQGMEREKLLAQAAAGYERLLKNYSDQPHWCAPALRSLGNIRATQGRVADAVKIYRRLEKQFPRDDWEILQAWKSAADLLWEAKQPEEAKVFYRKIVARFDQPDAAAIVKAIVRGSQSRLAGE